MAETIADVMRVDKALEIAITLARKYNIAHSEEQVFNSIISTCKPAFELSDGIYIASDKVHNFIRNFVKAIQTGDTNFLRQTRGLRVNKIVDIEEFTESPEYMNQKGYIRPVIKYELDRLFKGPQFVEAVLTGAIGIGKNYFADMALADMLYILSCYHNPQIEFDLAPGSSIIFIVQSINLTLAKKVVFEQFAERLRLSPYFQKHFPFDPSVKSELRFPNNIYVLPVGGSDTGAIGMNVFGGVIDELNFMQRTVDSVHIQHTGEEEYDQAERLYRALIRRMKSRFMQRGKLPGKLMLVSSVNYPDDFTDRKIKEAETDPTIFVMKYSQWDALPSNRFCGDRFPVEVGNELKQSRILNDVVEAVDSEDVIMVPVEYRTEFERDLDMALKDLAGVATGTTHPFIPYREQIQKAQDDFMVATGGIQLFTKDSAVLSNIIDPNYPDFDLMISHDYLENVLFNMQIACSAHIDVGVTNDAAGIAVGHLLGYKLMPTVKVFNSRLNDFVEVTDTRAPIYQIDGLLQLKAPPGGEVDLELLRDLMLYLNGFINLKWITMDSYQSTMMIQAFRKARIRSGVLSVDQTIAPYAEVKQSIKDERLLFPRHEIAATELRKVERDPKKDKIDHPAGGTKDVSDAIAGTVYILQFKEANYRSTTRRRTLAKGAPGDQTMRKIRVGGRRGRIRSRVV